MALIKCNECGKEISDKANACPHCGFPISLKCDFATDNNFEKVINPKETKRKKGCLGNFKWILGAILLIGFVGMLLDKDTENENNIETENENISVSEDISTTEEMTTINVDLLEEDEYKAQCVELFYDDVFFGNNLSKGDYIKLHLMVSENYYFTMEALYSDSYQKIMEEWDLYRDYKKCSVLRENEDSYFGVGKVDLYFSNNFEINPNDYDLGDKIIIYGKVISFYKDEWDGYNDVVIIPMYIEEDCNG